ncbi:hypothetical protein [Streptomyces diastatochromogenes]|uniref:Uncharacterized protein n=1 Tax=Streptomyces diastatochromogenes TaxID=42236 RepID=A0A233SPS0_STRDA|nr:hypothetical protein [Streptomyces diastatochromogenes]MCZ0987940.1 hypothetical protein [Streptomyces diastatochromogenes]OXY97651.1 hypothetical protein BEK98_08845 [Streptomyces diastatochromogenes]
MLGGLRDWVPDILFFGVPSLAGALLFIWRGETLRRRGVVTRATCVNQARDAKGLVTLRLNFEVDGTHYYCTSGIVPWIVGGIATVLLLLAGISYI